MTYDDVADIKAALQLMVLLLERIADSLEHIEDDTRRSARMLIQSRDLDE